MRSFSFPVTSGRKRLVKEQSGELELPLRHSASRLGDKHTDRIISLLNRYARVETRKTSVQGGNQLHNRLLSGGFTFTFQPLYHR